MKLFQNNFFILANYINTLPKTIQEICNIFFVQRTSNSNSIFFRYFSLQATEPLGFDDTIRFEVEGSICRENGPLPDCFSKPRDIVLHTLEKVLSSSNFLSV